MQIEQYIQHPSFQSISFNTGDEVLTDKEVANFCCVLIAKNDSSAGSYHVRVNHINEIELVVDSLIEQFGNNSAYYLIGGNVSSNDSIKLIELARSSLRTRGITIAGEDVLGDFNRRYWVNNEQVMVEKSNIFNKQWSRVYL